MTKKSKRVLDKETHYKNIIRKQKETLKTLKRQANRSQKLEGDFFDLHELEKESLLEEDSKEYVPTTSPKHICPRCKSNLLVIDEPKIKVFICDDCNYRATKRNL